MKFWVVVGAVCVSLWGCAAGQQEEKPSAISPPVEPAPAPVKADSTPKPTPEPEEERSPCPEGMVYVEADYCTKVSEKCLEKTKMGYPRGCVEFSKERPCVGEVRHQRFCIDTYEYPNVKGEYPPIVLDAFDAAALCREAGKRLCWESEWTAACEGAGQSPFPYGFRRDPNVCNIDNKPRNFDPKKMRSRNKFEQDAELNRITQHKPAGSMPGCKSDQGVFDLTGNVEEWIFLERPRGACTWGGTKGGHWLKVRNACRPTGIAHSEPWTFYVLSFRCCKDHDASAVKPYQPGPEDPPLWTPPSAPVVQPLDGKVDRGWVKVK